MSNQTKDLTKRRLIKQKKKTKLTRQNQTKSN